jgi:hypothetical protein
MKLGAVVGGLPMGRRYPNSHIGSVSTTYG